MKAYEWILFDADDTLFHFDALSGLKLMFSQFGFEFSEEDYQTYQTINRNLWQNYQNGRIKPQSLYEDLFIPWVEKFNKPSRELNDYFIAKMCEICAPLDGAISLIQNLKGKIKLGIITNGFSDLLQVRLDRTGLQNHFELLVISEHVGIAKPNVGIFEYALSKMGNPVREKVLIVGDNPDSDIIGGQNAGIDTCWLNIHKKPVPEHISPHYEISSLQELESLLLAKKITK